MASTRTAKQPWVSIGCAVFGAGNLFYAFACMPPERRHWWGLSAYSLALMIGLVGIWLHVRAEGLEGAGDTR